VEHVEASAQGSVDSSACVFSTARFVRLFFCALAERINTVLKDGRLGQKIEEAA
jgi:hypothetical protein